MVQEHSDLFGFPVYREVDEVQFWLLGGQAECLGNAISILLVDLIEVGEDALLDISAATAETSCDVFYDDGPHSVVEDFAEEFTRLFIVSVGVVVHIASKTPTDRWF